MNVFGRAPLDPSPDDARSELRRELLHPAYHDRNPFQEFVNWLLDKIQAGLNQASDAPPLGKVGAIVAFLVLILLIGWLVSRARGSARVPGEDRAVLTQESVTAAQLRARAEAALASGNAALAVVDGFRALTVRQIERGRLDDLPGATAHEVAANLAGTFPEHRSGVDTSAALFDLVLYGERQATPDQASRVLALDDELARAR